jgi:diguanylate cyclase
MWSHWWELVQNLGLIALASVAYSSVRTYSRHLRSGPRAAVEGMLFGGLSILAMLGQPTVWQPGVLLDLRLVPIVLAASFGGRSVSVIAVALAIICRLTLGGAGAIPGAASLAVAAFIGDRAARCETGSFRWVCLILAGSTVPVLSFLLLPQQMVFKFLVEAAPILTLFNFLGCLILGTMLARERWRMNVEDNLRQLSEADPLTGLSNRLVFDRALRSLAADNGSRSLLLVDLDDLKRLNDRYGHTAGDAALRTVAQALRRTFGSDVVTARVGGDEFAVLLPGIDLTGARDLAQRLRASLENLALETGIRQHLSMSIGGVSTVDRISANHLIEEADRALYAAKAAGRDRAELFDFSKHAIH